MAKATPKTVLFLCTGNYYRSRFAEIVFNSVVMKMGVPWQAMSRGLALERGVNNVGPIARDALQTLERMGIRDILATARKPLSVTPADFEVAERVIALKEAEHRPLVLERFPSFSDRLDYWDIDDVPGVLPKIETEVMALVARLLGGGNRPAPPPVAAPKPPEKVKKPLTARVGRETAGRRGKGVVTIFDLKLTEAELKDLAATLKQKCGTGGTVKDGRIEIQGDQRERVIAELEKLGYAVKRVGG